MASFEAELTIGGSTYPVRHCTFEFTQATSGRGRVQAKVRHGQLHLTLDVPDSDQLLSWAATPHQQLAGHVTFFAADQRTARETVHFAAGQCVGYRETFVAGDGQAGAYVCQLTITSTGLTLAAGGVGGNFVAPASREYAGPALLGGGSNTPLFPLTPAQEWAAAKAQAFDPARIETLYQTYKKGKKDSAKAKSKEKWWGEEGKRGGARHTVAGSLGEYQADQLFKALGHEKLSNEGQLFGLLDPPQGKGLDGVWRNGTPPPEYFITETKTTTEPRASAKLSKGQMSDAWVLKSKRLERAVGDEEALRIREAFDENNVEKRLLHIDDTGILTQYRIDRTGKITQ